MDNKLITLGVSEMKKVCEEYKKDFKNFISKIPV